MTLTKVRRALFATFPSFATYQPLQRRIHRQLLTFKYHQQTFQPKLINKVLGLHTCHPRYLQNLVTGAVRYQLNGQPSSQVVTAQEMRQAQDKLKVLPYFTQHQLTPY